MTYFRQKVRKLKRIWLKLDKIFLLIVILELIFPQFSLANSQISAISEKQIIVQDNLKLPKNGEREPYLKTKLIATAYNSLPAQTDGSPCITASGFDLCEHNEEDIIATNFLPIGTLIRIPALYGERVFRVEDRMHAKYYKHIDIWLKDYEDARKFGAKWVEIEVY